MSSEISKDKKELVQRTDGYSNRTQRLNKDVCDLFPSYGPYWRKHSMNTMRVGSASRFICYQELYKKIFDVLGVLREFGVRYGPKLINLRSIYKFFNYSRRVRGFDTFVGLLNTSKEDREFAEDGDYAVSKGSKNTLDEILNLLEAVSPMSHIKKCELIKGDVKLTIDKWLRYIPHAIISMCTFDMDIYKPTNIILGKILPRLTKGSLLVFEELNYDAFPGETMAVDEVLGLNKLCLHRSPLQTHFTWAVWGE